MIDTGEVLITKEDLKEIFNKDISHDLEHSSKILDIREKYQYSAKMRLEEEEFTELKTRVKVLFYKLRKELERLP